MHVLTTQVDTRSETYRSNRQWFLARLDELDEAMARVNAAGGPKYVERHRKRGKLMARERIELLLDRDAPFLEIGTLAAWGTDFALGGSMICGIGVVSGVECVIVANEPTIKGGSINPYTARKVERAMEICAQNRLPIINLTESGGADLPYQSELFVPGGSMFRELTRRSAERIPTICLVFGSSTAGGAYVPGMSDYVVMVKEPMTRPGVPMTISAPAFSASAWGPMPTPPYSVTTRRSLSFASFSVSSAICSASSRTGQSTMQPALP